MQPQVGFMGLGIMGAPMAANILKAEYPLTVYNRTIAKAEPLAQLGAQVAASPKALAQDSQIIIAMVTGPEALYELLFGPDGAAEAFGPEQVFINMSSVSPGFTLELGKELAPTAIRFVDAPVSGTKKPAEDAQLVILAGGNRKRVEDLEPLFLTMGKKRHCVSGCLKIVH